MDMLKLNSLQDMKTLPLTSWNIQQPAENDSSREDALDTGEQHIHRDTRSLTHVGMCLYEDTH